MTIRRIALPFIALSLAGCATIFGWNIHAPGILSQNYFDRVTPAQERIALYLPEHLASYTSKDRGGRFADPQTYYVGEAVGPMMLEAFQGGFEEFIFMEAEPTPDIMARYAIPYLIVVDVTGFQNLVTLKGQAVQLETETRVYNPDLEVIATFSAKGSSDAQKVFAKKGGPEVNLNAAIENNVIAIVEYLQDSLASPAGFGNPSA